MTYKQKGFPMHSVSALKQKVEIPKNLINPDLKVEKADPATISQGLMDWDNITTNKSTKEIEAYIGNDMDKRVDFNKWLRRSNGLSESQRGERYSIDR